MRERPLPADILAEQATLGSCLLDRDAIVVVAPMLTPDDFSLEKHAWIYQSLLTCYNRRVPPDLSTMADDLRKQERLEHVGGIQYLGSLAADVPTAVHVEYYAASVREAAIRRRLITTGGQITALGYAEQTPLDQTLDQAEQTLFAVTQQQRGTDFVPMSAIVTAFYDHTIQHGDLVTPSGLVDLDRRLNGGLHAGNLILLAARPGVGKTGLALTIAYQHAIQSHGTVGFVSLEMSQDELVQRICAMHTGYDTRQIRSLLREGNQNVLNTLGILSDAALSIEASSGLSIMDLRSKARRLHAQAPLDLLIVDYLQLLITDDKNQKRVDEVSRISRQLKVLARELNCPILALSQLNRAVEGRTNHVPMLSDLRDSGSLEQDSDVVLFIYREELYDRTSDKKGIAEISIAKNRNGPLGIVPLRFEAATTRFQTLVR